MSLEEILAFTKAEHARLLKFYRIKDKKLRYLICLKINEELGELAEEILSLEKVQRKEKLVKWENKIGDELADVLITLLLLGENLDINITKEVEKSIKKRKERSY
ncbi:MAG: MazG-like family protein [bacterium]|nr:MazG-like family protein [bacterium]